MPIRGQVGEPHPWPVALAPSFPRTLPSSPPPVEDTQEQSLLRVESALPLHFKSPLPSLHPHSHRGCDSTGECRGVQPEVFSLSEELDGVPGKERQTAMETNQSAGLVLKAMARGVA